MNELQSLDLYERLRHWVLQRRPATEVELRHLVAEANRPLAPEDRRLAVVAAFLGLDTHTASNRRALRALAAPLEPSRLAQSAEPSRARTGKSTPAAPKDASPSIPAAVASDAAPERAPASSALDEARVVGEDPALFRGRPLSPIRRRQVQRLWEWVAALPDTTRGDPPPAEASHAASPPPSLFGLHDTVSPEARVRSLRETLPFLKGMAPYRVLDALGFDVAPPDAPRQRLLFRLGFVSAAPGDGEAVLRETFEAMARLGRWAGEPLRVVGHLLGLFAGAAVANGASGGTGLAAGVAVCRARPSCASCPLNSLCLYERFGEGKRDGGAAGRRAGRIKDWAVDDRPRERMARSGPAMLADADLLAVVLRSGTGGKSAVELAREVLARFETLERLDQAPLRELEALDGIGPAKAAEIKAALELGKRVLRSPLAPGRRLTCSRDVFRAMESTLIGQMREQFLLLALNTKNEILRVVTVSIGNLSQSLVHPREVFREAIREAAAAVMLVHNHPSGDPAPSRDDELITQRLCRAGELLGIRVLDHIIVGRDRYYSFADEDRLGPGA